MTKFERYLTAWPRYHRSKGFGIHSPFAFRFVLRVLRERCPYYAYASLDAKRGEVLAVPKRVRGKASHVASRNEMRMLFRIANCFNPQRMLLLGEHCGLSAFALLSVSSKSEMRLWKSDYDGSLAAATLSGFGNRIEVDSSVEKRSMPILAIAAGVCLLWSFLMSRRTRQRCRKDCLPWLPANAMRSLLCAICRPTMLSGGFGNQCLALRNPA